MHFVIPAAILAIIAYVAFINNFRTKKKEEQNND